MCVRILCSPCACGSVWLSLGSCGSARLLARRPTFERVLLSLRLRLKRGVRICVR